MIFGEYKEDAESKRFRKFKEIYYNGFKKFAWFPRKLENGKWIWLEHYYGFVISLNRTNFDYAVDRYLNESFMSLRWNYFHKNYSKDEYLVMKLKGNEHLK